MEKIKEKLPFSKLILLAFQMFIVIFPATVVVPLITGFDVATCLFCTAFSTLIFVIVTKGEVPLYFGSSFSYISTIATLMSVTHGDKYHKIGLMTFGLLFSGLVNIIIGLLINKIGFHKISKIITPTLCGGIAICIGVTLAGNAVSDSFGGTPLSGAICIFTLLLMILFTVFLKGFPQQLSLLFGIIGGVILSFIFDKNLFRETLNNSTSIISFPHFVLPIPNLITPLSLSVVSLATCTESFAHLSQLESIIDEDLEEENKTHLSNKIDKVMIGDGLADIASCMLGGCGSTSYGEQLGLMGITKVYSIWVVVVAAIIAMLFSLVRPFINFIYAIPLCVIGAMEIYCFGSIIVQGISVLQEQDILSSKNLSILATVLIIGIGGNYAFGGYVPVFSYNIPCIAFASIFGIILNIILMKREENDSNLS